MSNRYFGKPARRTNNPHWITVGFLVLCNKNWNSVLANSTRCRLERDRSGSPIPPGNKPFSDFLPGHQPETWNQIPHLGPTTVLTAARDDAPASTRGSKEIPKFGLTIAVGRATGSPLLRTIFPRVSRNCPLPLYSRLSTLNSSTLNFEP